jgi:hypothetical protein
VDDLTMQGFVQAIFGILSLIHTNASNSGYTVEENILFNELFSIEGKNGSIEQHMATYHMLVVIHPTSSRSDLIKLVKKMIERRETAKNACINNTPKILKRKRDNDQDDDKKPVRSILF